MKAQTKLFHSSRVHDFGFTASDHYKIAKHRTDNGDEEMRACFLKLKELVPTVPQNKKVSKVQLLQHVIDYILDLELTLDFRPVLPSCTPPPAMLAIHPDRRPLAESSALNTTIPSETSHLVASNEMDTTESALSPPVSC